MSNEEESIVCVPEAEACTSEDTESYTVEATGASVTADSSVALIHQYCAKLPDDMSFSQVPKFHISFVGDLYECKLTLPPSASLQEVVGPLSKDSYLSKKLVCLEACKKLHQLGALDDQLLPWVEEAYKYDQLIDTGKHTSGELGTTKRKELYGTTSIHSLSGDWSVSNNSAKFQAYRLDFACTIIHEMYSGFVLLLESKLDEDVGNSEVELFLRKKRVKCSVSSCGEVYLDAEEVAKAKCFQIFFFNALFGKLFVGSMSSLTNRRFLLNEEDKALWIPSKMYLLLPIELLTIPSGPSWVINWKTINSCASMVEFLKEIYCSGLPKRSSLPCPIREANTKSKSHRVIYMANGSFKMNKLKEKVVVAIHTGRLYSIIEVLCDLSAESPFYGNSGAISSKFSTFREYFNKKYGIVLMYPWQPLVLVKQSHHAYNLLVNFNSEDKQKTAAEKMKNLVHMPPELLIAIDVPLCVLKVFYLLPSLMHRLECLMLASQLRKEISCYFNNSFHIPLSLILEALTTLRCHETVSMERLRLLGGSFLKYAVGCFHFLKFPENNVGQLTAERSWLICNSALHEVGTYRNLQGYIRDAPFEPRRWSAPGQRCIFPNPCSCGPDTSEFPLKVKFHHGNNQIVIGKPCDRGHRWMISKTIPDCVEALIGAYYVGGGPVATLSLMEWLGIEANFNTISVEEAIRTASLRLYAPDQDVEIMEAMLGYEFKLKRLLLKAITYASYKGDEISYCNERLEFLGDSVLDLLITRHLYNSYADIDSGELTDLRAANVNNENFAQVIVRHNLQQHLKDCYGPLRSRITEYANYISGSHDSKSLPQIKGPKVLGDLLESIAGAMLLDTKLDLDEVWRVFEHLLSPIVTLDDLELSPYRELCELCNHLGYFIKVSCMRNVKMVQAELRVQLKDVLLIQQARGRTKSDARGSAALHILEDLKRRGISYTPRARKKRDPERAALSSLDVGSLASCPTTDGNSEEQISHKRQKRFHSQFPVETSGEPEVVEYFSKCAKGRPRKALFKLCRNRQWPMPTFEFTEDKSRTGVQINEGSKRRLAFNIFKASISLCIEDCGTTLQCTGNLCADKKGAMDSAALQMLSKLEGLGKIIIDHEYEYEYEDEGDNDLYEYEYEDEGDNDLYEYEFEYEGDNDL